MLTYRELPSINVDVSLKILKKKLSQILDLTNCESGRLMFFNAYQTYATCILSIPEDSLNCNKLFLIDSNKSILKKILEKREIIIADFENENIYSPLTDGAKVEVYIPVIFKESLIGCIYLSSFENKVDIDDNMLLNYEFISLIIAISMNLGLNFDKENEVNKILNNLMILNKILKEKQPYMINRGYNLASWVMEVAEKLGIDNNKKEALYFASIFLDIGNIFIDANILNKKDKLTEEEYEAVKKHVEYGFFITHDLFTSIETLKDVPYFIKHHHERYDGKGYPDGLKGEEIPLECRIIAVADAVTSMLSERAYKKAKSINEIILEINLNIGKQFDPVAADAMIQVLCKKLSTFNQIGNELMLPASIVINTEKRMITDDGFLIKEGDKHIFKSTNIDFGKEVDIAKVLTTSLFIEKQQNLIEAEVKIRYIEDYTIVIDEVKVKDSSDSFSIIWNLNAKFIKINPVEAIDVNIFKISAASTTFMVFDVEKRKHIKGEIGILQIEFDDKTTIKIPGKIVFSTTVGDHEYFKFHFVNIPESTRDELYREMFRKQIEIRRQMLK
ncbi:Cyclic di-GMP phosphodiesterase response regulator RpfG [Caloramator mitchellensis]|uniref:Cyclic di-GMP phosphodiesterase response regulator RpfG n=1 Tax=Caloramator mitchellensis TaxID=908809 RepID=A0A0R3JTK9_CALMK|nr:HD domain-containing phosphohydrolase [Caloramator mitchellensis]KRQ86346.1 Cyclic di-GMP phosphodiesterase response regulator RpfG [Caloramator mitchellensis]